MYDNKVTMLCSFMQTKFYEMYKTTHWSTCWVPFSVLHNNITTLLASLVNTILIIFKYFIQWNMYIYMLSLSLRLCLTTKVGVDTKERREKGEIYVIWCFNLRFEFTDNTETWKLLDTKTWTHAVNFIFDTLMYNKKDHYTPLCFTQQL